MIINHALAIVKLPLAAEHIFFSCETDSSGARVVHGSHRRDQFHARLSERITPSCHWLYWLGWAAPLWISGSFRSNVNSESAWWFHDSEIFDGMSANAKTDVIRCACCETTAFDVSTCLDITYYNTWCFCKDIHIYCMWSTSTLFLKHYSGFWVSMNIVSVPPCSTKITILSRFRTVSVRKIITWSGWGVSLWQNTGEKRQRSNRCQLYDLFVKNYTRLTMLCFNN